MNIGFEAKRFFTNFTGLGNYNRFVVSALASQYPDISLHLFTPKLRAHPDVDNALSGRNIKVVRPQGILSMPVLSSFWRTRFVSGEKVMKELNVFHGLNQELPLGLPKHLKKVVTVHDLIFLRYPALYNSVDVKIYTAKVKSACHAADQIIAISRQTAEDLTTILGVERPEKIKVVYQGCHPIFSKTVSEEEKELVKKKYNLPDEYILTVGTIEERKNLKTLVGALSLVAPDKRKPLVVVGRATKYIDHVKEIIHMNKLESEVQFVHNVSFADLPAIYRGAKVFVYPSFFEGFGIPLVEAITCGVPVITSHGSCFSEAAGPDAIYADPNDAESYANALEKVLSDALLQSQMIKNSLSYIQKFQPGVIARNLMDVYKLDT